MKYITFTGDKTRTYQFDYNTNKFSEAELREICKEWEKEDNDGTEYFLAEIETERRNTMKTYEQKKEKVREQAKAWQEENSVTSKSYAQLINESSYFEKLGKRYGLLNEFRANGIC